MTAKGSNVVRKNSAVAKNLLANNTFYFVVCVSILLTETTLMRDSQDGVQGKRRFENHVILRALQHAFYNGAKSPAATDRVRFDPVPLASIALVCTIVRRSYDSYLEVPSASTYHSLYRSNTAFMNGSLESTSRSISMKPLMAPVITTTWPTPMCGKT